MLTRDMVIERVDAAQAGIGRRGAPSPVLPEGRRRGDHDLGGPDLRAPGPLVPAAVLVPLVAHDELTVLLTQRTGHLRDHAGQISFPGGRIEDADCTPEAAALRETAEEIGVAPGRVDVLGRLDVYETRTGYEVVPVVGLVAPPLELSLDSFEVDEAFEVPLSFVLDRRNYARESRMLFGRRRHFYVLAYEDRYIWGATAGMLVNLYEVLAGPAAARP